MATTNAEVQDWLKSSDSKEYFELLTFPSIGADPTKLGESARCATWLKKWLEKIGAEAHLYTKDFAPPVLFAEFKASEGAPTVLFYGHYDVQPPDPLEAWETPPFEPTVKGDRVYARGAQDDKGQLFAFLCGVREFLADNPGRINLKVVLEGQEESGSDAIGKIATDLGERLRADVLLVCDTGAAADLQPAIVAGLRGVSHFTVCLKAANCDLHSGRYGGIVPNAALGMAQLISSLHNPDGSIAVRGFCDKIEPPTSEELAAAESASMSDEDYEKETGVPPVGGEEGLSVTQRNSFRPTIELNGIHSGYGGPGSKTVIPCEAIAKLSMRLVPGQNPNECLKLVERHLRQNTPKGMTMEIQDVTGEAPAMRLPLKSPVFRLASFVLKGIDPRGAVFQWDGASIPIVSTLARISGAAPLLVGFGQGEDRIHSPNESFSWRQFALGREWARRILSELC